MAQDKAAEGGIGALAEADAPVFETLVRMTLDTMDQSELDVESYLLVRIAALVAMDAAPASYLLNIGTADRIGVPMERIRGTLVAVAPIVGSARIVSAARNIMEAFDLPMQDDPTS